MSKEWDQENMKTLACRVRKEEAAAFREYAAERSTTAHALLADYVRGIVSMQRNMAPSAANAIKELTVQNDSLKLQLERVTADYDELLAVSKQLELRAQHAEKLVHDYILAK